MSARTRLVRCAAGDVLPDALGAALRDAGINAGWVRGSGIVGDVELRTLKADGSAMERRFSGPMQIVALEGAIGARSELGVGVVLSRETDSGLETVAGTLVRARVVLLEALVVELDTSASSGAPASDPLGGGSSGSLGSFGNTPTPAAAAAAPFAATIAASPPGAMGGGPIPQRPVKPPSAENPDAPVPEVGDVVEHFAFGTCDVMKTDGDRIHLRVHRDQRIKEIAPEMLRVVPLDLSSTPRRFRLERKL